MPYPTGLPTKNVSFGRAVLMESGTILTMRVTIKASRNLVYRPTGQPLVTMSTVFKSSGQTEGAIQLPICNSPDMGLGNGSSIDLEGDQVTHTYTATVEYLHPQTNAPINGATRIVGPFVVLSSHPASIDIDDLLVTPSAPQQGISVHIPDVWSASVAAAEAAAAEALEAAQSGGGNAYVHYTDGAWPSRPTDNSDITVAWIGGTPEDPPTDAVTGVDIWIVEETNPDTGAPAEHTHPVSDLESGAFDLSRMPAGVLVVVTWNETTSTWPARPARADLPVLFVGGTDAVAPTDAVVGVDIWLREPSP